MIAIAVTFGLGALTLALLFNLYRLIRGPGIADRILAVDTMTINAIALIVLYGVARKSTIYFEAALLFAMVGFVSTVAFSKFILRGNVIE